MVKSLQYIWQLLILSALLELFGGLIIRYSALPIPPGVYLISITAVTVINLIAYLIMAAGIRKKDQGGMVILLAGLGVKFLLYLLYIMVFWLATKNLDIDFIVTFFALYLIFTFFLAIHLLKLLNNK